MDDLKSVFDKIEKAEALLNSLDKKRTEDIPGKETREQLREEHQVTIDSARHTIASIKEKLGKDLAAKTVELDKCQEDLSTLQTRLKVGEISEETFTAKSKHLVDKIKSLETKVVETQAMINARFAEDIAPVLESEEITAHFGPAAEEKVAPEMAPANQAVVEEAPHTGEEIAGLAAAANPQETTRSVTDIFVEPELQAMQNESEETKQEAKAEDTVKAEEKVEEKKEELNRIHKPSLHLHPLRGIVPEPLHTEMPDGGNKNRVITVVIAAFVVGLLIWGGIAIFAPRSGSNVGDTAPNFVMQLGDNTSALSSFRGKTVLLAFWDRDFWDGQFFNINGVQRRLYTPDKLNQLYNKYPRSELAIVVIASGTSNNEIDKLIQDYSVQFPVIVDSFGKLRDSYKIAYEPTLIFLDKDGVIRARVEGPITTMSDLEQYVYNTSKNVPIKPVKPPINDVLIQKITEKSASVSWTTDKPTTTQVDIDGKNIQTVITPAPQTLHSLDLKDLEPATAYHVRIVYNIDNINVSEHSFGPLYDTVVSKKYVVNTSIKDTSYPEISNINSSFITDSSVTVTWKTDEPASGNVDFSINKTFGDTATQNDKMSIWHTVKVDGLKPDTAYNLKLRSKDASGRETSQEIEPVITQNLVEIAAKVGKRAPDFTLYSIDGTKFTLSQFQGRPVLLNFWLEGCPACEAEMPLIQTAYSKYSRDQLVILAVNVRGDQDKIRYLVAKEKYTFPVLLDTDGSVDDLYRAQYFPTSYFIDSKGIIQEFLDQRFQTVSQIDDSVSKLK